MRCLYEVLGIARDADDGAIKTAYRRAALQWHPDKNQDRAEEAADRFKEIQNAYEVLSDAHERAWYDSHRDAILRSGTSYQAGADGCGAGQPPDSEFDLYPYFSAACFKGYGDGPQSFYGVYGDVFARLAAAEREAGAPGPVPAFGGPAAAWAAVSAFYDWWSSFATAKDFAWADEYNPASAPNRKVRRLIEDDNRKRRAKARREFNETVRELAAFVRKRDKRVAAQAADAARAKAQREQEAAARREAEKLERAARARAYQEPAWVRGGDGDGSASASGGDDSDDSGAGAGGGAAADAAPLLHCVACDKLFRSAGAMANHERSKKHAEAVAVLRAMLAEDDALVSGSEEEEEVVEDEAATTATDEEGWSSSSAGTATTSDDGGSDDDSSSTTSTTTTSSSTTTTTTSSSSSSSSSASASASGGSVGDDEFVARLLAGAAQRRRAATAPPSSSSSSSSSDDDEAATDALPDLASLAVDECTAAGAPAAAAPPPPPAQAKRATKPRRAAGRKAKGGPPDAPACRVCGEAFSSRGALFKHLEASGHARAGV